jgi:hypothetical protein
MMLSTAAFVLAAQSGGTLLDLASYGLAGLLTVVIIIPMAIYILRDKDKQILGKDAEVIRLREENVKMREVLEQFPPAIQEMTRTLSMAIQVLERSK